jgi:hypothetical protein
MFVFSIDVNLHAQNANFCFFAYGRLARLLISFFYCLILIQDEASKSRLFLFCRKCLKFPKTLFLPSVEMARFDLIWLNAAAFPNLIVD